MSDNVPNDEKVAVTDDSKDLPPNRRKAIKRAVRSTETMNIIVGCRDPQQHLGSDGKYHHDKL